MCGIVGYFSMTAPVSRDNFFRALAVLQHRGPDDEGYALFNDNRVALGHRRLAIVGHHGQQPLHSEDTRISAVVNGEFYDLQDTRRRLTAEGHRFNSDTDSELAVHLYETYGLDFVHHLRGEFAVALWDDTLKQGVAVRDRFGIKPLLYRETGDHLWLASESKALIAATGTAALDENAWMQSLHLQYLLPHQTLFAGIHQLPPGHMLLWQDGRTRIRRYWQQEWQLGPTADPEELGHALEDAVRLRLHADPPVAVQLSGGLDSSSVLAIANDVADKPLPAFCIGFGGTAYDEQENAKATARFLHSDLHVVDVSPKQLLEALPDSVAAAEGLAINAHLPAKYLLHAAIGSRGFKVVLTGEGADELLLGYPHLRSDWQHSHVNGRSELPAGFDYLRGVMLADGETLDLTPIKCRLGFVPTWVAAKAATGFKLRSLMRSDVCEAYDARHFIENVADVLCDADAEEDVHRSATGWSRLCLANYILRTLGDGCEMAHGVEGRVPFLDTEVSAIAHRFDPGSLWTKDLEKIPLRRAMKERLPQEVLQRQKRPLLAPPLLELPAARAMLLDLLGDDAIMPWLERRSVENWIRRVTALDECAPHEPTFMTMLTGALLQLHVREYSNMLTAGEHAYA